MKWPKGFFTQDRKQLVLDLIVASGGVEFDIDEIDIGTSEVLDAVPSNDRDPNTYVKIKMRAGRDDRYKGSTGVLYRRVRFSEAGVVDLGNAVNYPFTVHSILGLLSTKFGVTVTKEDVEDRVITRPVDFIVLKAKPKSPVFFGDSKLYLVDRLLHDTALDGFTEYVAQ